MEIKKSKEIIIFISVICLVWTDPCTNFTELSSASKRDPGYREDSVSICDRYLIPQWYRVKDRVMSTSPPPLSRCGSNYPIWLNGSNPETADNVVILTACRVGFDSSCEQDISIEGKKCPNGDIVYNLQPPGLCNSAYCFENANPNTCVKETVTVVEVVYHNITWEEKITSNARVFYDPVIHFVCQFTPLTDGDLYYTIEWFIENEWVKNYTVDASTIDQLTFTTEDMLGVNKRMGEKIQCTVGAKYTKDVTACVYQSSTQFHVGFEVMNTTLTIERGGSAQILLKQNVPYVSRTFNASGVNKIHIQTKYEDYLTTKACKNKPGHFDKCTIVVTGYKYLSRDKYMDPDTWNMIHILRISSLDPLDYYIQEPRFTLRLGTVSTGHTFFSDVDFPDININVVEDSESWKGKRCSSYADPHMTSFDGYAYECQKDGCITGITYILYKNIRHRQEVQVRHGSCWGNPRCVCAVSARSGRDVFVVDFCDGREFINFPLCYDGSLQVFRDGDRIYRVFLATGTSVKIAIHESWDWYAATVTKLWYINVEIYPTVADVESTSGLCGYLDGKKSNDLRWKNGAESDISFYNYHYTHPNDFAKSWGLPFGSSEDLLAHNGTIYDKLDSLDNYVHKLCSCDDATGVVCSYKHYQDCKTATRGIPLPCNIQTSNRRKRDLRKHQERALLMKSVTRSQRAKRQTTISQEDATITCTRAFENSAHYDICLTNIPNFGNESLINCINDLVLTGNENLTQLHLETALSQCKEYISYNSTLQSEQSDIVYKIIILCSNNCSNRGVCNEGNCTCESGFGGSDCSFDLSAPPTITHISDAGLCDRTTEVCDDIAIYGRYFVQNPDSACHMMRSEVNNSGVASAVDIYQAPLIQRTLFEAECPLNYKTNDTWITEFVFNVTNDGSQFTDKFIMYVYQSTCQIFNNDSGQIYFTLQEHYCYIAGVCIPDGTVESNGSCLQCERKTDAYDWTNVCTTSTEMTTGTSQEVPSSITQTTESPTGTSTTSVSTDTSTTSISTGTQTTGVSNGAPVTSTIIQIASGTTTTAKTTTPQVSATASMPLASESTRAASQTITRDATETYTTSDLTSKATTHPSISMHAVTTMGPDANTQRDPGGDKNSQTGVIVGASISSLVVVVVVVTAAIMLKKKFTKRESVDAPNLSTDDFNIYPDRNTVPNDKFDSTTNLFSFSGPDEMYSRPPTATSMRKGSATVDLSHFYDSQHLDSLFTAKK